MADVPILFVKYHLKKYLNISYVISPYLYVLSIIFRCKVSIYILTNLIYISGYRSHQQFLCSPNLIFRVNYWAEGYTLQKNISLHIHWNLCTRSMTVVQYKISLLYSPGIQFTFQICAYNSMENNISSLQNVSGLSRRKRDTHHSYIENIH